MMMRGCVLAARPSLVFNYAALPNASSALGRRHISQQAAQVTNFIQQYWPHMAAGTGVFIVVYGLASSAIHVSSFLLHLDALSTLRAGIALGFVGASTLAGGALYFYRRTILNPKVVLRLAMEQLERSKLVRESLGAQIRVGDLQAWKEVQGHWSLEKKLGWVDPRVQMIFQVVGEGNRQGFASVEAVKRQGKTVEFRLIAVDTSAREGHTSQVLLVAGEEAKLHVKGQLRGFLQSERAAFIPQDASETDEEWLREQQAVAVHDKVGRA
jgi:hypothetical protein